MKPEVAIVDRGCKGVAIDSVKIYNSGLRHGITRGLPWATAFTVDKLVL